MSRIIRLQESLVLYKSFDTRVLILYYFVTMMLYPTSLQARAQICKLSRRSRINFKEPIPTGCVAWRAGATTLFLLGS
jgi:hypothetical protein